MTNGWPLGTATAVILYAVASQGQCVGDCNGDGRVGVDELVLGSQIALGREGMSSCEDLDADGSGSVEIDELVDGVASAFRGCPDTPTPTANPTDTATPTASPSAMLSVTPTASPTPAPSSTPTATSASTSTPTVTPTRIPTETVDRNPRGAFQQVQVSAQGATRLTLLTLDWLNLLDQVNDMVLPGGAPAGPCAAAVTDSCQVSSGQSMRTVQYDTCQTQTVNGHRVEHSGRVVLTVGNETYCDDGAIGLADEVSLVLSEYAQRERNASGDLAAEVAADLQIERTSLGEEDCAGPDFEERIEGTVHVQCAAEAESIDCPERGAHVALEARGLARTVRSEGQRCKRTTLVTGQWLVTNAATGESFAQSFDGFTVDTQEVPGGGAIAVTVSGGFAADCLGAVSIRPSTLIENDGEMCPSSGSLETLRPSSEPDIEGPRATVDLVPPPLLRGEDRGEVKTEALASAAAVNASKAGSRDEWRRNKLVEELSPHPSPPRRRRG